MLLQVARDRVHQRALDQDDESADENDDQAATKRTSAAANNPQCETGAVALFGLSVKNALVSRNTPCT